MQKVGSLSSRLAHETPDVLGIPAHILRDRKLACRWWQ
jgi:hypothetical protein